MNLYVHFPFCRRKCAYCALFSVAGRDKSSRDLYAANLANAILKEKQSFKTVYFGGGTPVLCDLRPIFDALQSKLSFDYEWTVELSPLDAEYQTLHELLSAGVNRISMGVQSLDNATLQDMGREHTAEVACDAFKKIRDAGFENAGIDLIAGWPSKDAGSWERTLEKVSGFSPSHCSVYSLIREKGTLLDKRVKEGTVILPDDEAALSELMLAEKILSSASLERYEISSYAGKGAKCKHNLAVWRGEDYLGFGAGAHGRLGLFRSQGTFENPVPLSSINQSASSECIRLSEEEDALERTLFRLRTNEGLNLSEIEKTYPVLRSKIPRWRETLLDLGRQGIIVCPENGETFILSSRGMEVCDAVLTELM